MISPDDLIVYYKGGLGESIAATAGATSGAEPFFTAVPNLLTTEKRAVALPEKKEIRRIMKSKTDDNR